MWRFIAAILLVLPATLVFAEPHATTSQTEPAQAPKGLDGDDLAVKRCLDAWGAKHPFKGEALPKYSVLETKVAIMGFGDDLEDKDTTSAPALILVKPSVAVMSKHTMRLLNPNGWYCLKSDITVMGKTALEVGCTTRIADAKKGVAVLGSNDDGTGHGVTVLGVTKLKRICDTATH